MPAAPLADCTLGAFQEENRSNNSLFADTKRLMKRRFAHNPYRRVILTPIPLFDSSMHAGEMEKMKKYEPNPYAPAFVPAEVPWETYTPCRFDETNYTASMEYPEYASSYYYASSEPYISSMDTTAHPATAEPTETVNTSVATVDKAVNVSHSTVSCGNTGTSTMSTPIKKTNNLYKMYVDGRPKVVRGVTWAEVKVELRLSTETFLIADVPQVFGIIVNAEELVSRYVIVEGDRGEDMGRIASVTRSELATSKDKNEDKQQLRVLREATAEDIQTFHNLDKLEEEALSFCKSAIHSLNMRTPLEVQRAVFQFDRKKLSFTYRSESYVEFKALLRALNRQYQCRIWMHQLNWEVNSKQRRHASDEDGHHKSAKDSRRRNGGSKRESKRRTEALEA